MGLFKKRANKEKLTVHPAREAYRKTIENMSKHEADLFIDVVKQINLAIAMGRMYVTIKPLPTCYHRVAEFLKAFGYKVEFLGQYERMSISWDQNP